MTKRRFRESMKSFIGSHIDLEKDEQLKGNKIETEDTFKKILKLVQGEDLEEKDGIKEPLVELIEGFHSEYQSLYAQYENLRGELRKKIHGKKEKETSSSSSSESGSDSDDSSQYKSKKNRELESEYQKTTDRMKKELDVETLEGIIRSLKFEAESLNAENSKLSVENAELKQKLDAAGKMEAELNQELSYEKKQMTATIETKIALDLEYQTALTKIQEADEIIRILKLEAENLNSDKLELSAVNAELKQKLAIAGKLEAEMKKRLEDTGRDKDNLVTENQTILRRAEEGAKTAEDLKTATGRLSEENLVLGQELEVLRGKISNMEEERESAKQQVLDLSHNLTSTEEENKSLTLKVSEALNEIQQAQNLVKDLMAELSQLKEKLVEKEREISRLAEMHEVHGNETSAQINQLQDQVTGFELELESSRAQSRDMEMQIESKVANAKQLEEENLRLQARILEIEMLSNEREAELSSIVAKHETNRSESLSRMEHLTAEMNNLLAELDYLRTEKSKLEELIVFKDEETSAQVKGLTDQTDALQQELQEAQNLVQDLMAELSQFKEKMVEKEREISSLAELHEVQGKETSAQINQLQDQVTGFELELESSRARRRDMEMQIESKVAKAKQLEEENLGLQARISEIEMLLKEREAELSSIVAEHETNQSESLSRIEHLTAEMNNRLAELDSLQTEKSKLEEHIVFKDKETSAQVKGLTDQIDALQQECQQAQTLVQDLTAELSQLKEKMVEKEKEISSVAELHEVHGNEASAQIKLLQAQVTGLELELESSRTQNRDMVEQIDSKAAEAKQLEEEILRLQARNSEIELLLKEREDELSSVMTKLETNQSESLSRIENLTAEVNNLLTNLDSLHTEKSKLEEYIVFKDDETSTQVQGLMDQANTLQQKLESLHSQKAALEVQLVEKTQEISEYINKVQVLTEEIVTKTEVQQKILEEKESSTAQIKHLELEVASLGSQKSDVEEQIRVKIEEVSHLTEEKLGLQEKLVEREKKLTEREYELSSLQEKHRNIENEASAQMTTLGAQVDNLQQELDVLQAEKKQLESLLKKEQKESSEGIIQLENQKKELVSEIAEQQKLIKHQEDSHSKLSEDLKQIEGLFQESKVNLEVSERKTEQMTAELKKVVESKDERVAELEDFVEGLKRDLEVKGDELSTLLDNVSQIEVKLRLSNQKLRVTEQLLTEKEEAFRKAEAKFLQKQRMMEERIDALAGIIVANKEAYHKMITDISERVNITFSGLEILMQRFEDAYGTCKQSILETSKELQIAKNWVAEISSERAQLKVEVSELAKQLQKKNELESALRETVRELEVKATKEEVEKQNLCKAVHQLEKKVAVLETMMKEKDEGILGLGEEKREAIRQLCVWIEYHSSRYDYLKEVLSKMTPRGRRAT